MGRAPDPFLSADLRRPGEGFFQNAAIDRKAGVDMENVTVKVAHGKVELAGEVSSTIARQAAYEAALHTPGSARRQTDWKWISRSAGVRPVGVGWRGAELFGV
jgi:hypothetical protein